MCMFLVKELTLTLTAVGRLVWPVWVVTRNHCHLNYNNVCVDPMQ